MSAAVLADRGAAAWDHGAAAWDHGAAAWDHGGCRATVMSRGGSNKAPIKHTQLKAPIEPTLKVPIETYPHAHSFWLSWFVV